MQNVAWIQSVPSAVADGCAALDLSASTTYPSATADGTDCVQAQILTLESKPRETS